MQRALQVARAKPIPARLLVVSDGLWTEAAPNPEVREAAAAQGWKVGTRSADTWPDGSHDVFVVDTLGELMAFYGCADVAFVGGSLQPVGGHNLLEPAAVGTPVVTGPHLHNFEEVSRRMDQAGALLIGADADAVGAALEALLGDADARQAMARAGCALVADGRGALRRTLELIGPDLPAPVAHVP